MDNLQLKMFHVAASHHPDLYNHFNISCCSCTIMCLKHYNVLPCGCYIHNCCLSTYKSQTFECPRCHYQIDNSIYKDLKFPDLQEIEKKIFLKKLMKQNFVPTNEDLQNKFYKPTSSSINQWVLKSLEEMKQQDLNYAVAFLKQELPRLKNSKPKERKYEKPEEKKPEEKKPEERKPEVTKQISPQKRSFSNLQKYDPLQKKKFSIEDLMSNKKPKTQPSNQVNQSDLKTNSDPDVLPPEITNFDKYRNAKVNRISDSNNYSRVIFVNKYPGSKCQKCKRSYEANKSIIVSSNPQTDGVSKGFICSLCGVNKTSFEMVQHMEAELKTKSS